VSDFAAYQTEIPPVSTQVTNGDDHELVVKFKDAGLYRDEAGDGEKHYVACPWKATHSMDSGPTETAVFIKDGADAPGFKCLHGHCADKKIGDVYEFFKTFGKPRELRGTRGRRENRTDTPPPSEEPDDAASFAAYAEQVVAPKSKPTYRKTGLASLDAALNGGLVPGQLVVINGLPSVGKTNLEDYLAVAFPRAGLRTIFAEGEMSDIEIRARLCAPAAQLALTKIEDAFYGERALNTQFEAPRLVDAARALDRLPLRIHGRVKTVAALRQLLVEHPCDILIVGVLQRFQPPEGMEPGRHAVEADINALKDLAQEFNIIVIAASHVQRPIKTSNNGERPPMFYPSLESARESGQIEGIADVVILLARDLTNESGVERRKLHWRAAKVRRGHPMPRFLHWTVDPLTLEIRDTLQACAAMKVQREEDEKGEKQAEGSGT